MSKPFKCRIGLHDYEQVDFVSSYHQLRHNILHERKQAVSDKPVGPPLRVTTEFQVPLIKKICIKCGKVVNEIDSAREKIIIKLDEGKTRRELVAKMIQEMKRG